MHHFNCLSNHHYIEKISKQVKLKLAIKANIQTQTDLKYKLFCIENARSMLGYSKRINLSID